MSFFVFDTFDWAAYITVYYTLLNKDVLPAGLKHHPAWSIWTKTENLLCQPDELVIWALFIFTLLSRH